ncbi:hypothetical protein M758_5G068700 [Ceratodon purpureus]|nr:hypothetical protein M758_5G068700 [Ceratodon purpureus]
MLLDLPHPMDLPLQSCRPRSLSEWGGSRISQLLSRRRCSSLELCGGFVSVRAREFHRIGNCCSRSGIQGSRRFVQRDPATRILSENLNCEWRGFGRSHSVGIRSGKLLGRSRSGIVHFEHGDRNCSDGNATNFEDGERPPFDLDLAVVLAGFAFEAYNTPPENVGVQERDAGDCETNYLALHFLREVYDGQILVKLKEGMHFPGLDLWGTSDPYVIMRCGDCEAQSKVIWATRDPVWNEEFKLNVKDPASQFLQIAAWDANIITAHRRMGNAGLSLKDLSDGKKHEVELDLGGMGGGGSVRLEVQYKSFSDLDSEKSWWSLPSLSDLLQMGGVEGVYNKVFGQDGIKAGEFVRSTLGSLPFLIEDNEDNTSEEKAESLKRLASEAGENITEDKNEMTAGTTLKTSDSKIDNINSGALNAELFNWFGFGKNEQKVINMENVDLEQDSDGDYVSIVVQAVGQTLSSLGVDVGSLPFSDRKTLEADKNAIKKLGSEFQTKAEADYVESGLAMSSGKVAETSPKNDSQDLQPMSEQLQQASKSLLQNTENFLGMWAVVSRSFPGAQNEEDKDAPLKTSTQALAKTGEFDVSNNETKVLEEECEDGLEKEAKRQMFQSAESAVEAWAMLATSLGGQSFVKSEFEKICFLENRRTDTEVAIWRDVKRRRLVFAFRGTEQTKWKDLSTDMNVIPVGFNPERIGGDFKEEVMVHGGFLNAYDSVRRRLLTLLQASIGVSDIDNDPAQSWQVYSTGHSLGGALATLFALELSSSKLAKKGHIRVTMYNFGSPRVGNKRFADMYNQAIKDSWRVVNHRDIIPTVPRLMGYCHVAHPIYLSAGGLSDAIIERGLREDGYHGDVIGEVTPDFVFENVMKGERKMLERLLQTEIAMLRAIRDGSALMQHMEDFYYIALLERVERKMARRLK